jgi:hypothetical protein
LKSRHILCRAIAQLLSTPSGALFESGDGMTSPVSSTELINEATDAVESGLALPLAGDGRIQEEFQQIKAELFRFGARVYQAYQPHFLTEFLLENLTSDQSIHPAALQSAALENLWRALAELQREGFAQLNTPRFEQVLENLRKLQIVEDRINALCEQHKFPRSPS